MSSPRRAVTGPALIVVSGPPGAGKTTLAHEIAAGVGCPAICRDEIRAGLLHAGVPDRSSRRTYDAFFDTLGVLLRAGSSVVAEAAFPDRMWRPVLSPLSGLAAIRVVHCVVDPMVARARTAARRTPRPDPDDLHGWTPISLEVPSIAVDTGNGYLPGLPEIVRFATGRP